MALWAFHNNPGIGGFGESNPILFGGSKVRAEKKRNAALGKKKRGSDRRNTVSPANNDYYVGQGDLICQIVKELVDNAVDACRSPASDGDTLQREQQKKRIRVDIRSFHDTEGIDVESQRSNKSRGEILQLTVTDTGCGMENIQNCVNAFQTSKGGSGNSSPAEVSSGRYGIGLTLCLLHAQRCVPNSRACISSATSQSKHLTRAFFEVDKHDDCVKCVQEEEVNFTTTPTESGTCVSLLIPGGIAAESAWPRLKDYFTRFGLCTKLHFELDVFAPPLSNRPIFIRSGKFTNDEIESGESANQQESDTQASRETKKSDEWKDLLDDDDGSKIERDSTATKAIVGERVNVTNSCNENERSEFANAVQRFWPNCDVKVENVARSIRSIKSFREEGVSNREDGDKESTVALEVSMAVCPDFDHDEQTARLQLVRIVNDVPIIENAEAHSCGIVHGVANKQVWGSFGLDIERIATRTQELSSSVPSFQLRDSNLVAPFINKNTNHKLLKEDDDDSGRKRSRRGVGASNDLLPANLRIGTILVVVHIRANPSALPLPTLSKGRLPLDHQPIDEALQLGLRDSIMSLQSTNKGLFLSTSQLRSAERDSRYIPALASAASRIICRSRNPSLRKKCFAFISKESTRQDGLLQESVSDVEEEVEGTTLEIAELSDALEDRLRLAIKVRDESMSRKRSKKAKDNIADEDFREFDSEKEEDGSSQCLISNKSNSSSPALSHEESIVESASSLSLGSKSSERRFAKQFEESLCKAPLFPPTEIMIKTSVTPSTEDDEDSFDDLF